MVTTEEVESRFSVSWYPVLSTSTSPSSSAASRRVMLTVALLGFTSSVFMPMREKTRTAVLILGTSSL